MAEEFDTVARRAGNVAFSGTGGGFQLFCAGDIEMTLAGIRTARPC
jgi:hypothetical protein